MSWRAPNLLTEETHAFDPGVPPVRIREGDLLFTRGHGWRMAPIAACQDGRAHVGLVLKHPDNGRLYVVSCTRRAAAPLGEDPGAFWPVSDDERTVVVQGAHGALVGPRLEIERRLWLLRPARPWTRAELDKATRRAQELIDRNARQWPLNSTYERRAFAPEMLHAVCGWDNYSADRYLCTEFVAELLRAAGRWPTGESTSVTLTGLRERVPGTCVSVF